jgi:hypothetical protein
VANSRLFFRRDYVEAHRFCGFHRNPVEYNREELAGKPLNSQINGVTGQVDPSTQVADKPTYQDLSGEGVIESVKSFGGCKGMPQMDWLEPFARNALMMFVQQIFGFSKNSLHLRLRWSPTSGTSIEGKVEDLHAIHDALEEIAQRKHGRTHLFSATTGSLAPYAEFLNGIRIEFRPSFFQASVTPERWLLLTGDDRALRCAASYFRFPTPSVPGEHHHLERYEGMDWIEPNVEPLVITVSA